MLEPLQKLVSLRDLSRKAQGRDTFGNWLQHVHPCEQLHHCIALRDNLGTHPLGGIR